MMIYHITSRRNWEAAQSNDVYFAPSLETEGFIHCSTITQIIRVANNFYLNQHNLVLLIIDPDRLSSELKWEAPAHPDPNHLDNIKEEELFPHIYGGVHLEAVISALDFPTNSDGTFTLPEECEQT